MGDVAIKAEGLGKRYRIGAAQESYDTLRDAIVNVAKAPLRLLSRLGRGSEKDTIWALKDVSFEIKRGEVVGIIGRNGAGKSTLLKILCRITKPTEGRAEIHGRVGSLLEVGTGFHPELTGRENIFLNGSILGMRHREIKARFDEIVAFAEVDKFLDTPVKRYSSGMRVRLAFAVAAHLEPEILLVDEVLAVGDAQFQKKCLGKMGDVAAEGRTVLLVSHNMASIQGLCGSCLLLEQGVLTETGAPESVIESYLRSIHDGASSPSDGVIDLTRRSNQYTPGRIFFTRLAIRNGQGDAVSQFKMGESVSLEIETQDLRSFDGCVVGVTIKLPNGVWVGSLNTAMVRFEPPAGQDWSRSRFLCMIEKPPLNPGKYLISLSLVKSTQRVDYVEMAGSFHVVEADTYGTGYPMRGEHGVISLYGRWDMT